MILVKFLSIGLLALNFIYCPPPEKLQAQNKQNFAGVWSWKKGADEFELTLTQNGDQVTGYHFAAGQNGNKIDEAETTQPPSITGTIKGKTATINFTGAFPDGNGQGTATMTIRKDKLYWKITGSRGEHYLPANAVMKKSTGD